MSPRIPAYARAALVLLLLGAGPAGAEEAVDPFLEVKRAFAKGERIPEVPAEADPEGLLKRVRAVADGCARPCISESAVARYRKAVGLVFKALRIGELEIDGRRLAAADVEAVYCPADRPGASPCRLRASPAAANSRAPGGSPAAARTRRKLPRGRRTIERAESDARALSGAERKEEFLPGLGGEGPPARIPRTGLDSNNPMIVAGKLPEIEALIRKADGHLALIGKPLLEIGPEEWDRIAAAIPALKGVMAELDRHFKEFADPQKAAARARGDPPAKAFLAAYRRLKKNRDILAGYAEELALDVKARRIPELKRGTRSVNAKLARYAKSGRMEDLRAAVKDLDLLFENAGVKGAAKAAALKDFLDLVGAGGVSIVDGTGSGDEGPRLVFSKRGKHPASAGEGVERGNLAFAALAALAYLPGVPRDLRSAAGRLVLGRHRGKTLVELGASTRNLLNRKGGDPALAKRIDAALAIEDPEARGAALLPLLADADRRLERDLNFEVSARAAEAKRAGCAKRFRSKRGRLRSARYKKLYARCLVQAPSKAEIAEARSAAAAADPDLGLYFVDRARYQLFMKDGLAAGMLPLGTRLEAWEIGESGAPPGTVVTVASGTPRGGGGAARGLLFALPDGSTVFQGSRRTPKGIERIVVVRSAAGSTETTTLLGAGGRPRRAETVVYDGEGHPLRREVKAGAVTAVKIYNKGAVDDGDYRRFEKTVVVGGKKHPRRYIEDFDAGVVTRTTPDGEWTETAVRNKKGIPMDRKNPGGPRWRTRKGRIVNGRFQLRELALTDGTVMKGTTRKGRFLVSEIQRADGSVLGGRTDPATGRFHPREIRTPEATVTGYVHKRTGAFVQTSVIKKDGSGWRKDGLVTIVLDKGRRPAAFEAHLTGKRSRVVSLAVARTIGSAFGFSRARTAALGEWIHDTRYALAFTQEALEWKVVSRQPRKNVAFLVIAGSDASGHQDDTVKAQRVALWENATPYKNEGSRVILKGLDEKGVPKREYIGLGKMRQWHVAFQGGGQAGLFSSAKSYKHQFLVQYARDGEHDWRWVSPCAEEISCCVELKPDCPDREKIGEGKVYHVTGSGLSDLGGALGELPVVREVGDFASAAYYTAVASIQDDIGFDGSSDLDKRLAVISNYRRGYHSRADTLESLYDDRELLAAVDEKVVERRKKDRPGECTRLGGRCDAYMRGLGCSPGQKPPCASAEERLAVIGYAYSPGHAIDAAAEGGSWVLYPLGVLGQAGEMAAASLPMMGLFEGLGAAGRLKWIGMPARGLSTAVGGYMVGGWVVGGASNMGQFVSSIAKGDAAGAVNAGTQIFVDGLFSGTMAKRLSRGRRGTEARSDAETLAGERSRLESIKEERAGDSLGSPHKPAEGVPSDLTARAREIVLARMKAEGRTSFPAEAEYMKMLEAETARLKGEVPEGTEIKPARDGDGGHSETASVEEANRQKSRWEYYKVTVNKNGDVVGVARSMGNIDVVGDRQFVVRLHKNTGALDFDGGSLKSQTKAAEIVRAQSKKAAGHRDAVKKGTGGPEGGPLGSAPEGVRGSWTRRAREILVRSPKEAKVELKLDFSRGTEADVAAYDAWLRETGMKSPKGRGGVVSLKVTEAQRARLLQMFREKIVLDFNKVPFSEVDATWKAYAEALEKRGLEPFGGRDGVVEVWLEPSGRAGFLKDLQHTKIGNEVLDKGRSKRDFAAITDRDIDAMFDNNPSFILDMPGKPFKEARDVPALWESRSGEKIMRPERVRAARKAAMKAADDPVLGAALSKAGADGKIAGASWQGRQGGEGNCVPHAVANMSEGALVLRETVAAGIAAGADYKSGGTSLPQLRKMLELLEPVAERKGYDLDFRIARIEDFFRLQEERARKGLPRQPGLLAIRTAPENSADIHGSHAVVLRGQIVVKGRNYIVVTDSHQNRPLLYTPKAFAEAALSNGILVFEFSPRAKKSGGK